MHGTVRVVHQHARLGAGYRIFGNSDTGADLHFSAIQIERMPNFIENCLGHVAHRRAQRVASEQKCEFVTAGSADIPTGTYQGTQTIGYDA